MEQVLIRNLPEGTKAALQERAQRHHRSMEAEARAIVEEALSQDPPTLADMLADPDGADIEFEPDRLGLGVRDVDL